MNRTRTLAAVAAAAIVGLGGITAASAHSTATGDPLPSQQACPTENSASCTWDAVHQGNGTGRSFWANANGDTIFYSHDIVHRLQHGHWTRVGVTHPGLVGTPVDLVHGGTKIVGENSRIDVGGTTLINWPNAEAKPVGTS